VNGLRQLRFVADFLLTLPAYYTEQGLCNGRASVCLSHRSTAATAAGGFAAERRRLQQISIDSDSVMLRADDLVVKMIIMVLRLDTTE